MDKVAISQILNAIKQLHAENFALEGLSDLPDELTPIGNALLELANSLESRYFESQKLDSITLQINSGMLLEEVLDKVYDSFRKLIPYDRIGFSLISEDGTSVVAKWARTDGPKILLGKDYCASLQGSSLEGIISTGQPRILNNLSDYLRSKPNSQSTKLVVDEGMRSSLTCPLMANGKAVGFIFFSSKQTGAYTQEHVKFFERIAAQLSIILDKSKLISGLSDQKKLIEDQNTRLQSLNELKNSFLGIAAHDLRSPLANIKMILDMVASEETTSSSSNTAQWIGELNQQTEYMLTLLDELLDVTRIESGKLLLTPVLFELQAFLEEAVYRNNQLAIPKKTHITLESSPQGKICADPKRLRQVLDNLISNAIKYSPPGSRVKVQSFHEERGWKITVTDEGPGITERDRERIFKDFAKLSARPTGGEKSTGLGLAISRRVIEAHGGTIGVDSQTGGGSVFWFIIPD